MSETERGHFRSKIGKVGQNVPKCPISDPKLVTFYTLWAIFSPFWDKSAHQVDPISRIGIPDIKVEVQKMNHLRQKSIIDK